jgi:hypothetical protein
MATNTNKTNGPGAVDIATILPWIKCSRFPKEVCEALQAQAGLQAQMSARDLLKLRGLMPTADLVWLLLHEPLMTANQIQAFVEHIKADTSHEERWEAILQRAWLEHSAGRDLSAVWDEYLDRLAAMIEDADT